MGKPSTGSSWQVTRSPSDDPLRPSLVERAKKRKVRAKGDRNWWSVDGSSELGDSYDSYDVHLRDDGSFYCSCEGNRGGEFRKVCSHRTAVILWRRDHDDPWEDESTQEDMLTDILDMVEQTIQIIDPPISVGTGEGSDPPMSPPLAIESTGGSPAFPAHPHSMPVPAEQDEIEGEGGSVDVADVMPFDPFELDWDNPPPPQIIATGADHPLPEKFQAFRPDQWHGIIEAVEALDDGVKAIFISAPTGSGKSLLAATIPQILNKPFIYTCTTHVLQNQILSEFSYAKVLKGRANYPTFDNPSQTTEDCTLQRGVKLPACPNCPNWSKGGSFKSQVYDDDVSPTSSHCHSCHPTSYCPYRVAKDIASNARMAVLNTSYLLSEANHLGGYSSFSGWDLVVIDEADTIEQELMRHITVEVTPAMRKKLNIGLPEKKTVEDSWIDWVKDEVIPAIETYLRENPQTYDLFGKPEMALFRTRESMKRLKEQMKALLRPPPSMWNELDELDGEDKPPPALSTGWVYTGYKRSDGQGDKLPENVTVTFKPITVREYAQQYLWRHAKQFVLMSATIISPEQMAYDLGLEDGQWAVVEIPSSFPKERRPVIVSPRTFVTYKTKREAYPVLVEHLAEIMERHPDERILVHSNSYDLTKNLYYETRRINSLGSRLVAYFDAKERKQALDTYLRVSNATLVAPSFDRGVDLHGDDCRVIVVAKVPYPSLTDDQVSARLYSTGRSGRTWYAVQTIRTICQMTGRGMRSKDDWVRTYILDKQFLKLYWENQKLFPSWWREALVFDENDPKWRTVLSDLGAA